MMIQNKMFLGDTPHHRELVWFKLILVSTRNERIWTIQINCSSIVTVDCGGHKDKEVNRNNAICDSNFDQLHFC